MGDFAATEAALRSELEEIERRLEPELKLAREGIHRIALRRGKKYAEELLSEGRVIFRDSVQPRLEVGVSTASDELKRFSKIAAEQLEVLEKEASEKIVPMAEHLQQQYD